MPDDSSGNFTLVPSYKAAPGETIKTIQHNPPLEDIGVSMSRRLSRDGRGGMMGDLNFNGFRGVNVGAPITGNNIARLNDVRNAAPVGGIIDYAGVAAPPGWLFCNGQAVSRYDYEYLFTIIGTTFGAGDGVMTFNVPDLRGCVVAGLDNMGAISPAGKITRFDATVIGSTGGDQGHILTIAEMPSHSHSGGANAAGVHNHSGLTGSGGAHTHSGNTDVGGNHIHTGETNASGSHSHGASYDGASTPFPGGLTAASMMAVAATAPVHVAVNDGGTHSHQFSTISGGAHSHPFVTNQDGLHSHAISDDGGHTHILTIQESGGSIPHNNIQPTMVLNKIIRAL